MDVIADMMKCGVVSRLTVAVLCMFAAPPALASGVAPIRVVPVPIIPPPFVVLPDTNAAEKGLAPNRLTVVVGGAIASDYEGSDDYGFAPVAGATARLHGHSIAWQGNSLGVDLVPEYRNQTFKFIVAPFVTLNLNRTRKPRDPVVVLTEKSKMALEAGVVLGFTRTGILTSRFDSISFQVSAAHDLGSVHRSFIITPSIAYVAPLSKAMLVSASASVDVVGSGYAHKYFGIDSGASASSGLPLYRPEGGLKSATFGLGVLISLGSDLRNGAAVGVKLNYERLFGGFANSPLVAMRGTPNQLSAAVGLAYTF